MILFFVSLWMFSVPLILLEQINEQSEDASLIGDIAGSGIFDAFLKQYRDVLAGFEPQNYTEEPLLMIFTVGLFLLGTFFT